VIFQNIVIILLCSFIQLFSTFSAILLLSTTYYEDELKCVFWVKNQLRYHCQLSSLAENICFVKILHTVISTANDRRLTSRNVQNDRQTDNDFN